MLRYTATAAIVIVGPVTGRRYRFSAADATQPVAPVDVRRLLATGLFAV
jgi:hypothetical protein